jgi:hypothetical protein
MRTAALFLLAAPLAACSSNAQISAVEAPSERIAKYSVLHVSVRSQESESEDCVARFRQRLTRELRSTLFPDLVGDAEVGRADLRLLAVITEIRDADTGERVFKSTPDRVRMRVQVDLQEARGGRFIGRFRVDGYGSSDPLTAVDPCADAIADYLYRYR